MYLIDQYSVHQTTRFNSPKTENLVTRVGISSQNAFTVGICLSNRWCV